MKGGNHFILSDAETRLIEDRRAEMDAPPVFPPNINPNVFGYHLALKACDILDMAIKICPRFDAAKEAIKLLRDD